MKLHKTLTAISISSIIALTSFSVLAEPSPMPMGGGPYGQMPMSGPGNQGQMMNPEMMQRMMQMRQQRMNMMNAQEPGAAPQPGMMRRGMPMMANSDGGSKGAPQPGMGMMGKGMPMMEMMQQRHATMQAHMTKMETHMANIEALLAQLVELQKR